MYKGDFQYDFYKEEDKKDTFSIMQKHDSSTVCGAAFCMRP